jgi:hypothetical protein
VVRLFLGLVQAVLVEAQMLPMLVGEVVPGVLILLVVEEPLVRVMLVMATPISLAVVMAVVEVVALPLVRVEMVVRGASLEGVAVVAGVGVVLIIPPLVQVDAEK